jgi:RNA polymerase sigma-70 factor (ECF subfamily)
MGRAYARSIFQECAGSLARQDEFERVALCHSRSLLRVARRLTSHSAAEDLVQDCLFLAWRSFHQFQSGTNARAWLFRILFNVFYADGRKLKRMPEVIPLLSADRTVCPAYNETMDISRALDGLQLEHRTVLLLGVVEGFTCAEMADILSVPVGTVMSRLSRARHALRSRLVAKADRAAPGLRYCAQEVS